MAGQPVLRRLLLNPNFLTEALAAVAESQVPEAFLPTDLNGVSLYRDPDRKFSLQLFIWEPYRPYPIHDHGSWGVVGVYRGQIGETKYRVEERPDAQTARLCRCSQGELAPGETTAVLPLDVGLHGMKALGGKMALTVHAYGEAIRKGTLSLYHPSGTETGMYDVYSTYPLYSYRRLLALEALAAVGTKDAAAVIERVSQDKTFKLAEAIYRFV